MTQIPNYPCIQLRAKTHGVRNHADGSKEVMGVDDEGWQEDIFVPITGADILTHIYKLRREKRWPVIAYHHLEKLVDGKGVPKPWVAGFRAELEGVLNPPEQREPVRTEKTRARANVG